MSDDTFSSRAPNLPMPTIHAPPLRVERRAVALFGISQGPAPAPVRTRGLGQRGHAGRDGFQRVRPARCRGRPAAPGTTGAPPAARRQRTATLLQTLHQGRHGGGIRRAWWQQRQFGGVAAPDALYEAAVQRRARERGGGTHAARARGLCVTWGTKAAGAQRGRLCAGLDPARGSSATRQSLPPMLSPSSSGFAVVVPAPALELRAQAAQRGIGPGRGWCGA